MTISLQPFARRVESCLTGALVNREQRMAGMSVSIDLLPLLLGHGSERSEYFSRMVNGGVMTPNEARRQTGLQDITGGDILRSPVNTLPTDQLAQPEERATAPRITKLWSRHE